MIITRFLSIIFYPLEISISLMVLLTLHTSLYAQTAPLKHAHAHNDYAHKRPLLDALDNGFTSIEVDVYLHNGQLRVSHLPVSLRTRKTLEELYLIPLQERIALNGGNVFAGNKTPIVLMIDFKTEPASTYKVINEILKLYANILTSYSADSVLIQRPVNVLISGKSPVVQLLHADSSYATLDAPLSTLEDSLKLRVCTRLSDAWSSHFSWNGKGEISKQDSIRLENLVKRAQASNKEVRFYHIPDHESVWKLLLESGVDWINTDRLSDFRQWYTDYQR
ncbi:MAG: hypothetical protein IPN22_01000 [Bacteroidetes bacterium]|nr:hypothetical protein [Bacteroidota bacterium]